MGSGLWAPEDGVPPDPQHLDPPEAGYPGRGCFKAHTTSYHVVAPGSTLRPGSHLDQSYRCITCCNPFGIVWSVTFITKQALAPPSAGAAFTIPAFYILEMRECRETDPNVVMMSGSTIGMFREGRSVICLAGTLGAGRNHMRIGGLLTNEVQGTKGMEGRVGTPQKKSARSGGPQGEKGG